MFTITIDWFDIICYGVLVTSVILQCVLSIIHMVGRKRAAAKQKRREEDKG